jgi:ParB family chromosome partitioning protein
MPTQVETEGEAESSANPTGLAEADEDEGLKPIPDRLMTELTAYRTLALRQALGEQSDIAFLAALHALCIKIFYRYAVDSCLELDLKSVGFGAQAPGLNDTVLAACIERRHQAWVNVLPQEPTELWDALVAFDRDSREALLAHCVSLSVNAVFDQSATAALAGPCRSPGGRARSRPGRRRLVTDCRQLSRPRHQGAHCRRGQRGARR